MEEYGKKRVTVHNHQSSHLFFLTAFYQKKIPVGVGFLLDFINSIFSIDESQVAPIRREKHITHRRLVAWWGTTHVVSIAFDIPVFSA